MAGIHMCMLPLCKPRHLLYLAGRVPIHWTLSVHTSLCLA